MDRATDTRGTDTSVRATPSRTAVAQFRTYVDELREAPVLPHDANGALRRLLPLSVRRSAGAFFTTRDLAAALVAPYGRELSAEPTVLDPTCGAGDLLIAATRHFRDVRDHDRRLEDWSRRIHGRDLFEDFVLATRLRMCLAATTTASAPMDETSFFLNIRAGCSLSASEAYGPASHVLMNPPFTLVNAPSHCEWRVGRTSAAALFVEQAARHCEAGTRIAAILPDVLRSGSGYAAWRASIGKALTIERVTTRGTFARWADVDVFLLHARVSHRRTTARRLGWIPRKATGPTIGDHFTVTVGPVVDYRTPRRGPWRSYLTVDRAPSWGVVRSEDVTQRRFSGTALKPPALVVRRTSRFGDRYRAVATMVHGFRDLAVENHLIILRPIDGTLATCERGLEVLRTESTREWLDQRIRCRHLTVAAVRDIPWAAA